MKDKKKNDCDCLLSDEDLRAALLEMKTYIDVTEEDLKKIYEIALRHARERKIGQVLVQDVMTKHVITATPDGDLHEVARIISKHNIGGMPVVDEKRRVLGVISQSDILIVAGTPTRHAFKDFVLKKLGVPIPARKAGDKVKDVMSVPPITCKGNDDLRDVAVLLDERRIKRIPVIDDEGTLIGLITRSDIIRFIGKK